jgi:uncharacterized surface protein with fasciclin (FAS1) repeats
MEQPTFNYVTKDLPLPTPQGEGDSLTERTILVASPVSHQEQLLSCHTLASCHVHLPATLLRYQLSNHKFIVMHSLRIMALAAVLFLGGSVAPVSANTIVDIASSDEQFSSLVDAVVAADLADTLASAGPFTVFAPTNSAFEDLPSYVTDTLEKNPELLGDILLYHTVGRELFAADVLKQKRIKTVQGESLRVNLRGGAPFVDNAKIIATDVDASNGVVHVIDTVLIPNSVYQAVIHDLRAQLHETITTMAEVRKDQVSKTKTR